MLDRVLSEGGRGVRYSDKCHKIEREVLDTAGDKKGMFIVPGGKSW